ncbi:hypothetical protein [Polluticoccus soli]|uniref:hypothetical protein n=1 Tax=Polluticoccus soli TaxID=3034150 RepID=UPI0023E12910|nr:hypothetical protein [Flavipsychrobacter sp. JY13-12]
MRKLLIITCLLSTGFVAFGKWQWKKKKKEPQATTVAADSSVNYKQLGAPMPPIRMITPDKKVITEKDVANSANLFVIMFNPTCGHCQDETVMIGKHINQFKKSKIVMLASPNMEGLLSVFEGATGVSKLHPTVQVGLDSADFITKTFGYEALPQINVYNKDRKLVKTFNGDTPMKDLEPYIE